MSNSIVASTNISVTLDTLRVSSGATTNLNISSSAGIAQSQVIGTGAYEALSTTDLPDLRNFWSYNDSGLGTSSVVCIATDNAGANPLTYLYGGDSALVSWSGSVPTLYAKAVKGPAAVIQYIVTAS